MKYVCHSVGVTALLVMGLMVLARSAVADDRNASPDKERELIALLRSEAAPAEKAIACKRLAIHGSSAAVPDLARLLENQQLASWARIALEVIPGPEASSALRQATNSITGRLLVGAINSIGVRRDADAVDLLIVRLKDDDAEVASAAAVALGRIGNAAAAKALLPLLASAPVGVRSAIAEGAILCAERTRAGGKSEDAVAIYDEVRKADVPRQRVLEATRGAILARKPEAGVALLIEQLGSKEPALFQIGLSTAREFPGSEVDQALAAEMSKAVPERAALIVVAMADRKETVVLPAVLKAAVQSPKPVRLAAINALGRVGNDSCLQALLNIAIEADADVAAAAKASLGDLPGTNVDEAIVAALPKAQGKLYPLLLELIGQRRIEAVAELKKALEHSDKAVRTAALTSLGATVPPQSLGILVTQLVNPKYADDAPIAQQALMAASIRMPDREACAEELSAALGRSALPKKIALLQILGAVSGTKALQTIGAAAKSEDSELQDASTRLLGEWMTIDAAPVLLDLSQTIVEDKYKVRALRGYIRICRQFVMPEAQRIEMCQKAIEASRNPAEQKLMLDVLKRYPSIGTLRLALQVSHDAPELKGEATQAAMAIAQKLGDKGPEVMELLSKGGLSKVNVEIAKAEYGSGDTKKDVTEVLQKAAAGFQLISLPRTTYNESFGGDPAPNVVKQLTVQYRINGKEGQATFAENTLIILPMPK